MRVPGFGMTNGLYTGYDKYARFDINKADNPDKILSEETAKKVGNRVSSVLTEESKSADSTSTAPIADDKNKLISDETESNLELRNATRNSRDIQDFTFDFKKNNDFNLVGARSKVEDVNIEKALSDMKKDDVLEQYKFFVKGALASDGDGSVRQVIRKDMRNEQLENEQ